mgnify:CR=1 FL=1
MNDSKVYQMSEDMEHQYLTEDSKIRLYLSPVRPERRKETITKKIIAAAVALPYSIFITYITGKWMIESVAKVRGYDAIGGEYIVVVLIFMASFRLVWSVLGGDGEQE